MSGERQDAVAVALAFTEALNGRDHAGAARLLADDVELVFPGARLQGRDAWLESRRRQQPPEHLDEQVEADDVARTADGAELMGRLVQRWKETGEVASELPVRIGFTVDAGLIQRLEMRPG